MSFSTRFAPSPSGPLHLGHAYSALLGHDMARAAGGAFHLRIDDLDRSRARPHWEQQIITDLTWLGVTWDGAMWRQSERLPRYRGILERLWDLGVLYSCTCTRADIAAATRAPQEGTALIGPDGLVYPGTCRQRPRSADIPGNVALRLDMRRATQMIAPAGFEETGRFPGYHALDTDTLCATIGDVVLSRRDLGASYHLAIVLDDADQAITHVVRGEDLFDATKIHVLLQKLLDLPTPVYHHHRLVRDDSGKRLAKRDDARAISTYRAAGLSPADIRAAVGL